jgi:lipopolysaccharide/colanic/teichoic acid biosynthesis glycosyltransferase
MFDFHGKFIDRMLLPEGIAGFHPISRVSRVQALPPGAPWRRHAKRGIDVLISLVLLTFGFIPMALIALTIRLDSPGPIFFRQWRIGMDGQPFEMRKFRTMRHAPVSEELHQATRHDPRITRVGAWLRRTSLDELPQCLNILRGEMSLVGPRPHAPGTRAGARLFEDVTPLYAERHRVKPGMTGLAQVRGWRGETDTEQKLTGRLACDLEYIETWSLRLDLSIIMRTIPVVARMLNAY